MRAQADVVVVAGAPVLEISHTIALARASDIVAMVADVRHTAREAVSAAVREIRSTGPVVIVGVVTGVSAPASGRAQPVPAQAESIAPASEAPAILAGVVPPRGPNGQQREPFGAPHVYSRRPRDTETGPDDGPGSREAH
jgi:Mrp family chromosome partitioning ATPase